MDTITDKIISAWRREGLPYVVKNAPQYLYLNYLIEHLALDREDLVSHCKERDQIWYYDSGTQFEMSPPLNEEVPTEYEDLIGTRSVGSNFVCEVSNARLVGPYAIPVTPAKRVIKETFGTDGMFHSRLRRTFEELGKTKSLRLLLNLPALDRNHTQYDTVAHLVVRHGPNYDNPNYGHWINENLPQLQAIEHYRKVTGENVKLLINMNPPCWLKEILEFMGYSSDDWIVWDSKTAMINNLIIPKLNYIHSYETHPNPRGKRWARAKALNSLDNSTLSRSLSDKVFMSRQGSHRRKIKNFDAVKSMLNRYDFDIYRPENLSIIEEAGVFSQANIIVGVAGSNIAGIVFSSDATLIELLPHDEPMPVYYTLANEMRLQYAHIFGKPIGQEDMNQHRDVYIDIDHLSNMIQEIDRRVTDR